MIKIDFDICESCPVKTNKFIIDYMNDTKICFKGIYEKEEHEFYYCYIQTDNVNDYFKKHFNDLSFTLKEIREKSNDRLYIMIKSCCPYYIEHRLSNWSKNEH